MYPTTGIKNPHLQSTSPEVSISDKRGWPAPKEYLNPNIKHANAGMKSASQPPCKKRRCDLLVGGDLNLTKNQLTGPDIPKSARATHPKRLTARSTVYILYSGAALPAGSTVYIKAAPRAGSTVYIKASR